MKIRLNKNDKILLAVEVLFMIVYVLFMCGEKKVYEFNAQNLEIYNDNVIYSPEEASYTIQNNGAEAQENAMLGIAKMEIDRGAYEITVRYESSTGINGQTGNCENQAGSLRIRSFSNPTEVGYKTLQLVDGSDVKTDRLWITSLGSIQDLDVKVYFHGYGILKIDQIVFEELMVWRVTCVLKWIVILSVLNFIYFYFIRRNDYKDKHILAGLLFMVLFSSLLAFQDYVMGGHDLSFHLTRILSLARSIAAGNWISPIQSDMANGYGYAAPLFYGQIFLYIPAILYNMAIPLHICYQIYVVCVNIATCLVSYFCFKAITENKEIALFGAYCYQLSAYRIIDVYIRAALGEYTAMIFLPLILYGFYKVYETEAGSLTIRDAICIVLGLTGIIQSHLITVELAAFAIVALCAALFRKTLQPRRLLILTEALALTILCNINFLVPFFQSMQMDIAVNAKTMGNMQELGAAVHEVFGVFMYANGTCALGIGLMLGVAVFFWCCVKRFDWGLEKDHHLRAGVIALVMLVFTVLFSFSAFPWDSAATADGVPGALGQLVGVVQFPWRFHIISTILCVFLTVLGVTILYRHGQKKLGTAAGGLIALLLTLNVGLYFVQYTEIAMTTRMYASVEDAFSLAVVSGGEYQLVGTDFELCKTREITTEDQAVTVTDYRSDQGETMFVCANQSDRPRYVEIPVFCYDNYCAYDRGSGDPLPLEKGTNNRIRLLIPGGYSGEVCVVYEIPIVWKVCYLVSALTMAGIAAGLFWRHGGRRQKDE